MRLWGGRFSEANDARVEAFTSSIDVDRELAADDLAGSIAHVRGLGRAGLLTDDQVDELVAGLTALAEDVAADRFDVGPRARGRPSQPRGGARRADRAGRRASSTPAARATTRSPRTCGSGRAGPSTGSTPRSSRFERALVGLAEREGEAVLPGTTHIQPAQPVLFAHHLLAYVEMAERDRGRLARRAPARERQPARRRRARGRRLPARSRGDGRASSGSTGSPPTRSMPSSDRDFVVEVLAAVALGMVHLSRLAEEITWWSNPRFGFVRASDAFSTGSSIMPNKKNPDPGRARPRPRGPRHRGADRGPRACSRACPSRTSATSRRTRRRCSTRSAVYEASLGVLAGMLDTLAVDAARMREAAGRGLHDRDRGGGHPGPARHPVPCRPPRRRLARGRGRDRRHRPRRASMTRRSSTALDGERRRRRRRARRGPRDRRRAAGRGLDRRRARVVRRHRRDGARTGSRRRSPPPGRASTPRPPPPDR